MSYWDYFWFPRSVPKPVKDGIKTKSRGGSIGKTWWSKRWIEVLESFNMGARLGRGRSYARRGQVMAIDVQEGLVTAKVQGSRPKPYQIKIALKPLSPKDWHKVTEAMAEQAIFVAKLLAGEMPQNIEEAFEAAKVPLFPQSSRELETDCSCPDWANPCKHIAAVYYLLAEQFDDDPFLIFKLRGKSKEQLISELREKRAGAFEETTATEEAEIGLAASTIPLEECLGTFWEAGAELAAFSANPTLPEVEFAVLKRLGKSPFKVNNKNVSVLLERAYETVSRAALAKSIGEVG
ncbi:MAG: SWIM zinc finger family protein [candidate division KSB1 bacterium]|nr:SWIM zinc finger family protein [candidate division KSB1 bacterium]MDZ7369063.1 SWIM zinc finger family protein [candidate division KSB1 bacterium]MDZ7407288.1 SWIM zinc finger family protein [candidate division KSB1 bacterium]